MAISFPSSPVSGQMYTVGGKSWLWDGTSWNLVPYNTSFLSHSSTHSAGGTDAITISPSQVTGTAVIATDTHLVTFCTSSTRPGTPTAGQVIYETDTGRYYGWKGSFWASIGGGAAYQTSAPSGPQTGDLWIDSDATASLNENDYLLKADAAVIYVSNDDYTHVFFMGGI